jgi:hypothetical protein
MNDEAARQGRPATTSAGIESTTGAGREPTVDAFWTAADQAELDTLAHALASDFAEHRRHCESCNPEPCPLYAAWLEHKAGCRICEGLAPITHGWSCPARERFLVEHRGCVRCLQCPRLLAAVRELCDWREFRLLLSRAEALRAQLDEERAA